MNSLLLAMVMAVMWLFFNANVNRQIHVLADGYVISHAHPFKGNPADPESQNDHRHSRSELMLLSLVSSITSTLLILLCIRSIIDALPQIISFTHFYPEPAREYYQLHHYHAPPAA